MSTMAEQLKTIISTFEKWFYMNNIKKSEYISFHTQTHLQLKFFSPETPVKYTFSRTLYNRQNV